MSDPVSVPSIWPALRTLTLTGVVRGAVQMDGSQDVMLSVRMPDDSLTFSHVSGLGLELERLNQHVNNSWSTGRSTGPLPTKFGGDLDQLIGATYVFTHTGTANTPDPESPSHFLILQNGPTNFGQQIALREGQMWFRSQEWGTWGSWRRAWSTNELDPSVLLLKTDVAGAAQKLSGSRAFRLEGDIKSDAVQFDGTGNVTLKTTIAEGSVPQNRIKDLPSALSKRLIIKGIVRSGQALNTLLTTGLYVQPDPSQVQVSLQYPVSNQAGILEIYSEEGLTRQVFTTQSNIQYRRTRFERTWSNWSRTWQSTDFQPDSKLDKVGGEIVGDLRVGGQFSTERAISVPGVEVSGSFAEPKWLTRFRRGHQLYAGIRGATSYLEMALERGSNTYSLKITDNGQLTFNGQGLWHQGSFNPANPVPNTGVLQIGGGGGKLLLRKDGNYSLDDGESWRPLNDIPQDVSDPVYQSLRFITENGAGFFPTSDGGLTLRVGRSGHIRTFEFSERGDLVVPGRVLIGGNERPVWHEGNFNPRSKLDTTATAAAATRLATPRRINGVAFDGTEDIIIRATVNPDEYIRFVQDKTLYSDASELQGRLDHAISGHSALGTIGPYMATWNLGVAGHRDGQFSWEFGNSEGLYFRSQNIHTQAWKGWRRVWTDYDFSPEDKLDYRASLAPQAAQVDRWDATTSNGWYCSLNAQDAPEGTQDQWLYGRVIALSADSVLQETWLPTPHGLRHWTRQRQQGVWGSWTQDKLLDSAQLKRLRFIEDAGQPWTMGLIDGVFGLAVGANPIVQVTDEGHVGFGTQPHPLSRVSVAGRVGVGGPQGGFVAMDRANPNIAWEWSASGGYLTFSRVGGGELASLSEQGGWMAGRLAAGWDSGVAGSVSAENWFRSTGQTGLYFSDYGGGLYMTDSTYVRTYNDKAMAAPWFHAGPRGLEIESGSSHYRLKIADEALVIERSEDGEVTETIDVSALQSRVRALESEVSQIKQLIEDLTSP